VIVANAVKSWTLCEYPTNSIFAGTLSFTLTKRQPVALVTAFAMRCAQLTRPFTWSAVLAIISFQNEFYTSNFLTL
jgi:hypothetical protein